MMSLWRHSYDYMQYWDGLDTFQAKKDIAPLIGHPVEVLHDGIANCDSVGYGEISCSCI